MKTVQQAFLRGVFVLGALCLAGAAQAQNWSYGQPANWGGPYIGAVGGVGWGSSRHTDGTGFDSGSFMEKGGLLGGEAGYNWQMRQFIVGLEGDMSWSDIAGKTVGTGDLPCGGGNDPSCRTRLDDLGTVRGRIGLDLGQLMPYATGGLAFGKVRGAEGNVADTDAYGAGSDYRVGWAAGAGVEAMVMPSLSVKLEYLHVDLGRGPLFTDTFSDGSTAAEEVGFRADTLRAGVAYHF